MSESKLWFLFIVAALILLVFLGIHLGYMHLDNILGVNDPLDYNNVKTRGQDTFWLVSYLILLVAALYHGMYGLRTILLEYFPQNLKFINGLIGIIGFLALILGSYVVIYSYIGG
ncbi:hypothetical protein [Carboxydothermus pertinax]|uniref:Succinate dehydrogenase n=1 Tax=Carboxydothermus pertinax TaxID=870242 RepID=A0A1L8CXF6_9THEO|nr:hypothetical protein [Carboxydothermus pertinax]GAV23616.1 hypothetical protein cpu_21260 [Carboxydothermus pertinax]